MLKQGILGLLNYGNMTGYEIKTIFQQSLNYFWTAQTSQIYRELQSLEKVGWVTSTHVIQKGKPDKKVFSITKDGKEELQRWLREDLQSSVLRIPLLMQTFFRGECSYEENLAFFRRIADNASSFPGGLELAVSAVNAYAAQMGDPEKVLFWKFTIEYGKMHDEMLKAWSEKCIKELEEQHECTSH